MIRLLMSSFVVTLGSVTLLPLKALAQADCPAGFTAVGEVPEEPSWDESLNSLPIQVRLSRAIQFPKGSTEAVIRKKIGTCTVLVKLITFEDAKFGNLSKVRTLPAGRTIILTPTQDYRDEFGEVQQSEDDIYRPSLQDPDLVGFHMANTCPETQRLQASRQTGFWMCKKNVPPKKIPGGNGTGAGGSSNTMPSDTMPVTNSPTMPAMTMPPASAPPSGLTAPVKPIKK